MGFTDKYSNTVIFKALISFVLLFVGGLIYLGWRSGNLVMFQLLDTWGMSDLLIFIRNISVNYSIYDWVKYSAPDGLWLFSYMFLIDAIWDNHRYILYYIFLLFLPIIALLSELFQCFEVMPGTFDIVDLFCYILAIVIFVIIKLT